MMASLDHVLLVAPVVGRWRSQLVVLRREDGFRHWGGKNTVPAWFSKIFWR